MLHMYRDLNMKNKQPCRSFQALGALLQLKSIDRAYSRPSRRKAHADIHLVDGGFAEATENSILHLQ